MPNHTDIVSPHSTLSEKRAEDEAVGHGLYPLDNVMPISLAKRQPATVQGPRGFYWGPVWLVVLWYLAQEEVAAIGAKSELGYERFRVKVGMYRESKTRLKAIVVAFRLGNRTYEEEDTLYARALAAYMHQE